MAANRILLTGSSGLIGTSLVRTLEQKQISTLRLQRGKSKDGGDPYQWDPYSVVPVRHPEELNGVTGAVHLSGANVAGARWSPAYKREILESRIQPTHALAVMLAGLQPKPAVLVCASAVGIYGDRGDEILSESSSPGSGFLSEVCLAWERATLPATEAGIRVVHLRFGVVLSPDGGALAKMLPLFRIGLGGRLGSGRQWMSWITLPDVVRAIEFALETDRVSGPVNAVAPNPVTNEEFTLALGRALHRPTLFPVPSFALELAFGEMAKSTILGSQRVIPARLADAGFGFEYPELAAGLAVVLA